MVDICLQIFITLLNNYLMADISYRINCYAMYVFPDFHLQLDDPHCNIAIKYGSHAW